MQHYNGGIMTYNFDVTGVSYIGNPRSNTAMYATRKVENLLNNLRSVFHCVVFVENGMLVDDSLQKEHFFFFSDNPEREYAKFANELYRKREEIERKRKYTFQPGGYYIGENVTIGPNAYIEPQCIIGHDVVIGQNANILYGSVIKHSVIGDDFLLNEYGVIGAFGFTMAEDEHGNRFRIPTMGKVIIGNHVEIGAHDNISCGTGSNTIIEEYVKLDALVHVGHDACLERNARITAGSIIGGYAKIGSHVFLGVNSSIRNRIAIGENSFIGMGSNVTKSVDSNVTVAGNPARTFEKD